MLALAVHTFCTYRGNDIKCQSLFPGDDSEGRFSSDLLLKVLKFMEQNSPNIDLDSLISEIGSHSNRKGAASYLLGMFMISAVNVYLREDWSLGNVQDRYIFAGAGGDQIVGRAVTGLPIHDMRFATLPPHFAIEDLKILDQIGWNNAFGDYEHYPDGFKQCISYFLASIVYHQDWIKENFPDDHPIFNQPICTKTFSYMRENETVEINIIEYFKDKVLLGEGYCEKSNLQAS